MPEPTPGQVAYETYLRTRFPVDGIVEELPWYHLGPGRQAAWEAAAQAVRAMEEEEETP